MTETIATEALPHFNFLGKEKYEAVMPYITGTYTFPDDKNFKESIVGGHDHVWPAAKQYTALITGVRGQDGSYLADNLLQRGYKVVGMARRTSTPCDSNILSCLSNPNFELVTGDITDYASVSGIVNKYKPDEIYNLAAQSFVKVSFDQPFHTFEVDTLGVINFLEVIRRDLPEARLYQASTSEMFGKNFTEGLRGPTIDEYCTDPATSFYHCKYQDEKTPFMPQSPYGIAKLASHHMVSLYREAYGLHASCGILFNHESPRRGIEFVTRKITDYVAKLDKFLIENADNAIKSEFPKLQLGNLDAYRDWGHAADYVEGMRLMLRQDKPDDYILCTGTSHTVRDFCKAAFDVIGVNYEEWVEVNPAFYRPAEVDYLMGRSHKAREVLGWKRNYTFDDLVQEMVREDIRRRS